MKFDKKTLFYCGLSSIFLLAIFLRFWKVPELFYFGIDEEYQAHLAWSIVKDFHIIWIGLSAANTGFYVGPGFTYLNALLFWISKGDPLILGYFSSLLGVITLIVLYFIVKEVFNKKAAFITMTLYGLSHFVVMYDRRFWNSTFVPLIVVLMFYSLVKAQKNSCWYTLSIFLIASAFHIHASLFLLIPLLIFVFTQHWKSKKYKVNLKLLLVNGVIFLAILSPLIMFDIVHNFDNLKTPWRMIHSSNQGPKFSFVQHMQVFVETISQAFYINLPVAMGWLVGVGVISWLVFFLRQKKTPAEKIFSYFLITYIIGLLLYPGLILEYYYIGFMPILFITLGVILENMHVRFLIPGLMVFVFFNMYSVLHLPITGGLTAKKILVQETSKYIQPKNFYLDTHEPYLFFGGWKYLFDIYGKTPAKSEADDMFGWIYQKEIGEKPTTTRVLITETDIIPKGKIIKKISSGPYKSYVFIEDAN